MARLSKIGPIKSIDDLQVGDWVTIIADERLVNDWYANEENEKAFKATNRVVPA